MTQFFLNNYYKYLLKLIGPPTAFDCEVGGGGIAGGNDGIGGIDGHAGRSCDFIFFLRESKMCLEYITIC